MLGSVESGELDRAGTIAQDEIDVGLIQEPVVDGGHGHACPEHLFEQAHAANGFLVAADESAAMDVDHERSGGVGLGFPEIHDIARVRAVADIFEIGFHFGFGDIHGFAEFPQHLAVADGLGFREDAVLVFVGIGILLKCAFEIGTGRGGCLLATCHGRGDRSQCQREWQKPETDAG